MLQAWDDRGTCPTAHGRGRRSRSLARRPCLVGAGGLRRCGRCGWLLHIGAGASGRASARWPGLVGPNGWPDWADGCVRGQRTAARAACVPMTSPWRDYVRHARDRRVSGHVGQARPGARVRRGVPGRLAVPSVRRGAARARAQGPLGVQHAAAGLRRKCVPGPSGVPGAPAAQAGRSGPGRPWALVVSPPRAGPQLAGRRPDASAACLAGEWSGQCRAARLRRVSRHEPETRGAPSGPAAQVRDSRSVPGAVSLACDRGRDWAGAGPERVAAGEGAPGSADRRDAARRTGRPGAPD